MSAPLAIPQGALLLLEEDERAVFDRLASEVRSVAEVAIAPIATDAEAAPLNELLARGKKASRAVEEARKKAVAPLNNQVKALNDLFRPLVAALDDLEARGKRCILAWDQTRRERERLLMAEARRKEVEAQQREAEARAKAEAAKTVKARETALKAADLAVRDQALAVLQQPPETRGIATDSGSTHRTERWVFSVVDPLLVPREYLAVDPAAIRRAVAGGAREIPGVAIYLEEGVAIRTKSLV